MGDQGRASWTDREVKLNLYLVNYSVEFTEILRFISEMFETTLQTGGSADSDSCLMNGSKVSQMHVDLTLVCCLKVK